MRFLTLLVSILLFGAAEVFAAEMLIDGKKVDVPICGGIAGIECRANQWCDFPASAICGGVDQFGTCRLRPEVCTEHYLPVCGCDGNTYGNTCKAAHAGFDTAHAGKCEGDK